MKMYKFNGGKTSKGKIIIYHLLFIDELSAQNYGDETNMRYLGTSTENEEHMDFI